MGSQMESKYSGKCKVCGSTWKVGEQMFYQKDPKVMCNKRECFESQGGKIYEKSFGGNSFVRKSSQIDISKINLPDMDKIQTRMTQIADEETIQFFFFKKRVMEHGGSEIEAGMLWKTACDRTR